MLYISLKIYCYTFNFIGTRTSSVTFLWRKYAPKTSPLIVQVLVILLTLGLKAALLVPTGKRRLATTITVRTCKTRHPGDKRSTFAMPRVLSLTSWLRFSWLLWTFPWLLALFSLFYFLLCTRWQTITFSAAEAGTAREESSARDTSKTKGRSINYWKQ